MPREHDEYEELPQFVKDSVSRKEWLWMGAVQRARLIQDMTEPDIEEP